MPIRSSRTILLSFSISIFVSSLLSLPLEKELGQELCEDEFYSQLPGSIAQTKPGESSSRYLLHTQERSSQKGTRTTTLLERLWGVVNPIPMSAREHNWKIYYELAPKVLYENHQIPDIRALTEAVTQLGNEFTLKKYTPEGAEEDIKPRIRLADRVLGIDALGLRDRIWVVGVLSCLKSKIPEQRKDMVSKVFEDTHLDPCRGNIELFLLKDQSLGEILREMWPESLASFELQGQSYVVWEGMQRASLAEVAINPMAAATRAPSRKFQEISKALLSLGTPIDMFKASRFTNDIAVQLYKIQNSAKDAGSLEEEKIMVQILLHMQENHYHSRIEVLELLQEHNIGGTFLEADIRLQLEDKQLDSLSKTVYRLLQDVKKLDIEGFNTALKAMIETEISIHQWGKLLRILEVSNTQNPHIYSGMDKLLSDSPKITAKFSRMTHKIYSIGGHKGFKVLNLIRTRGQDLFAAIHRLKLEKKLISEGVVSAQTIEPFAKVLTWNYKADRRAELTHYLKTLCVQIFSKEETLDALQPSDTIIEYILHIISLNSNNKKILKYLSEETSRKGISAQTLEMIRELHKSTFHGTFKSHLKSFENYLLEDFEFNLAWKSINEFMYSTRDIQL